jgi:hypothetical protein
MENGSYWRTGIRSANRSRKDAQLTAGTSTGILTIPRPNNAGRYGLQDHAMTGKYYIWNKTWKHRFTVASNQQIAWVEVLYRMILHARQVVYETKRATVVIPILVKKQN